MNIKGTQHGSGEHRRSWEWEGENHIPSAWSVRKLSHCLALSRSTQSFIPSTDIHCQIVFTCCGYSSDQNGKFLADVILDSNEKRE